MSNYTEREAFEKAMQGRAEFYWLQHADQYGSLITQRMWETWQAARAQQGEPSPDVTVLVEALEGCAASLAWSCFGECRAVHAGPILPATQALEMARAVLDAHRKQEPNHDN